MLCCGRSLKTSLQRSAFSDQPKRRATSLGLRPSADLGLGLGLGGPWVALGWPKGHPSVAQGPPKRRTEQVVLFATRVEKKAGVGVSWLKDTGRGTQQDRVIRTSGDAVIGKARTLALIDTDNTDRAIGTSGNLEIGESSQRCASLDDMG
jgi:hypothetical protein